MMKGLATGEHRYFCIYRMDADPKPVHNRIQYAVVTTKAEAEQIASAVDGMGPGVEDN